MDKDLLEKEMVPFLSPDSSVDPHLKQVALDHVLGITGSEEGCSFLHDSEVILGCLVSLTGSDNRDIQEMTYKALINLSVRETTSWKILHSKGHEKKVCEWIQYLLDPEYKHADLACKMLSNLTRGENCAAIVAKLVLGDTDNDIGIDRMVLVLCNINYNKDANLNYLAAVLSNLSQSREIRTLIMDKEKCIVQRLLPFTEFKQSSVRRAGVIGILKNCCFDSEYHEWLLGDQVDLLPRLLLPLAGPEEFDDDDNDRLPDDLQYLPEDKQREPDPDVRKMICEALLQLCATRNGRSFLKTKNAYVIMREYYAWERKLEPANEIAAMNLIDILIGDDPTNEFGENLKQVDIPEDMVKQFHEDDAKEQKQVEQEKLEKSQQESDSSETKAGD